MNANLVKYGKYGAVALVVGLVAYMIVQKNKKTKAEALVEAAKKAEADKKAAIEAAAIKKYSQGVKGNMVYKGTATQELDSATGRPLFE